MIVTFITHTFTIRHCYRPPANDLNRLCCLFFSASFVSGMAKAEPSNLPDPEKNPNFRQLAGEYTAYTVWGCFRISAYAPRFKRLSVCTALRRFNVLSSRASTSSSEYQPSCESTWPSVINSPLSYASHASSDDELTQGSNATNPSLDISTRP